MSPEKLGRYRERKIAEGAAQLAKVPPGTRVNVIYRSVKVGVVAEPTWDEKAEALRSFGSLGTREQLVEEAKKLEARLALLHPDQPLVWVRDVKDGRYYPVNCFFLEPV